MDAQQVKQALTALVEQAERPQMARLREVFDEVEEALARGVSREQVLAVLHAQGLTLTLRSFDTCLYRLRKARGGQPGKRARTTLPAVPVVSPATAAEAGTAEDAEPPLTLKDVLDPVKREARADKYFGPNVRHYPSLMDQVKAKRAAAEAAKQASDAAKDQKV